MPAVRSKEPLARFFPWCAEWSGELRRLFQAYVARNLDRADSADLLDLTRSELGLAQTASRFPRKDDRQHLHSLNPEQRVPDQGRSDDPVETPWAASPRASARISWLRRVISSAARRVKGLAAGAADRGRSG
jgi:hypothetical protein